MRLIIILLILMIFSIFTSCGKDINYVGFQGPKGEAGTHGVNGADGKDGTDGVDGTDATGVYMVKLCPGQNIYPSVFIEYGFCVDNKLYGTYSANGGFSTYLPPGIYSSNAIGSSCTFTIDYGCHIQ